MNNVRRDDERTDEPAVDQAWRAAATDEPSAQFDATILAAARAATTRAKSASTTPASRHWWAHWQPLAAAAGVAGLAFTIVQMVPRDSDVPATPSAEQAIERARPDRTESVTQQNAAAPPPAPREADMEPPVAAKRTSPAVSPPNEPTAGAAARDVAGAVAEADASSEQGLRQIRPPPAAPTPPEDWARRIETLYGAGEESAAADALQAFREAYADADQYLAESLQPWAASVNEGRTLAKEPTGITP